MASSIPGKLSGMADVLGVNLAKKRSIVNRMETTLAEYGYEPVETPILEQADLFLRKTGNELASQMYSFTQQGGQRITLRPEWTSPIIRLFLEAKMQDSTPVRWQYTGPVFRRGISNKQDRRQFTQVGAELIGENSPSADAEILAAAISSIQTAIKKPLVLTIGNIGTLQRLLDQFDISERAILFFLNTISTLTDTKNATEHIRQEGERIGIFQNKSTIDNLPKTRLSTFPSKHPSVPTGDAGEVLDNLPGGRSVNEILERMQQKMVSRDEERKLETALSFISEIINIQMSPDQALTKARGLVSRFKLDAKPLEQVEEVLGHLSAYNLENVEIAVNFGLARGISYYTGLIFEIHVEDSPGITLLGGGGRYDGLVKALGGPTNIPALGFACTIESVLGFVDKPKDGRK